MAYDPGWQEQVLMFSAGWDGELHQTVVLAVGMAFIERRRGNENDRTGSNRVVFKKVEVAGRRDGKGDAFSP